jgi:hypothetical protein
MKNYRELSDIYSIFKNNISNMEIQLKNQLKKVYDDFSRKRTEDKINLLKRICMEEQLDFNTIKYKYLSSEDLCMIENDINSEFLLDNIIIEGHKYYYEKKENGIVYDVNSNRVGIFKNNHIIID